jgi:tRNA nucleotidyltransferase (CCA-adding enzyme)
MERLRFPIEQTEYVCNLIREHMSITPITNPDSSRRTLRRFLARNGKEVEPHLKLHWADKSANTKKTQVSWGDSDQKASLQKLNSLIAQENILSVKNLAINGNHLIAIGYTPGPLFDEILKDCLEQIINDTPNTMEALLTYVDKTFP